MTVDAVVAGAGPAGLVCARELAARGLSVRIVGGMLLGGELLNVAALQGAPGEAISGAEYAAQLTNEATEAGVELDLGEVQRLTHGADGWSVETDDAAVLARAVVVATGAAPRPLTAEGADRLTGRGVCYCVMCDGPLFAGQDVAVVGGDRWAGSEALCLADVAGSVILLEPDDGPPDATRAALDRRPNIRTARRAVPLAVRGESRVECLTYADDHGDHELAVAAVFGVAGRIPNSAFLDGIAAQDETGRLIVDGELACSAPGLFAAGVVRAGADDTAAGAAADGLRAAASVVRVLAPAA